MLVTVLTPQILGPPISGALGLSLFSLMVNPRLARVQFQLKIDKNCAIVMKQHVALKQNCVTS